MSGTTKELCVSPNFLKATIIDDLIKVYLGNTEFPKLKLMFIHVSITVFPQLRENTTILTVDPLGKFI